MAIVLIILLTIEFAAIYNRASPAFVEVDPLPSGSVNDNCTLPLAISGDIVFKNGTEVNSNNNASSSNNVMPFLTVIYLRCWPGFVLQGDEISVCVIQDNWWPPLGICTLDVKEENQRFHLAVKTGQISIVQEIIERQVHSVRDQLYLLEHRNENNAGRTPLAEAAMEGYLNLVVYFVRKTANIRARDDLKGSMPIHLAAENGHVDIVDFFLGIDPTLLEVRNNYGSTPLFVAAVAGKLQVVQFLIENKSANVEARGEQYRTPLMQACVQGRVEVVKYLVENANASLTAAENDRGRNAAIHLAAENNQLAVVDYLLQWRPELLEAKTQLNDTMLNRAALRGQVEMVALLCQNKSANVENCGNFGRTPLLHAVTISTVPGSVMLQTIRILLDHGANPLARDATTDNMAIHLASEFNKTDVVAFFLDKFPDLLEARNGNNETVLIRAIIGSSADVVRYLVENRSVDIETRGGLERTPLMYAASRGDLETVEYLLNHSAAINATDEPRGNMAHHLAAAFGQLPVVKYILDRHPELVEARTYLNDTAMNAAASGGYLDVMSYLLDNKKANIENRGYRGTTPFLRAAGNGRQLAVQFLLEAGANPNATTDLEFNSESAMHLAATYNHLPVVRYLRVKCPQLFVVKNRLGQTPLEVALMTNSTDVARFIKQTIIAMIALLQQQLTTIKPQKTTSAAAVIVTTATSVYLTKEMMTTLGAQTTNNGKVTTAVGGGNNRMTTTMLAKTTMMPSVTTTRVFQTTAMKTTLKVSSLPSSIAHETTTITTAKPAVSMTTAIPPLSEAAENITTITSTVGLDNINNSTTTTMIEEPKASILLDEQTTTPVQ